MPARPGRTGRGGTPSPLLMKLLGGRGNKEDLSGIDFKDSIQPGALSPDGKVQKVNYTQKAVPQHFWNAGKAENVNNQLTIGRITGDQNAQRQIQTARDLAPIDIDKYKQIGANTSAQQLQYLKDAMPVNVEQARQTGNLGVLHGQKFIADPLGVNEKLYNDTTTNPNLREITSGMELGNDKNNEAARGIQYRQDLLQRTAIPGLNTAENTAKEAEAISALGLNTSPAAFDTAQKLKALQLPLVQSEINKNNTVSLAPGGEKENLVTGKITKGPPIAEVQMMQQIEEMRAAKAAAASRGGNTPGNPPVPTTFNTPATPPALPAPLATQATPSMPEVRNVNGVSKVGRMVNGVWTEYTGQ